MTLLEAIPEELGITGPWIETGGVHWLTPGVLNVRQLASAMKTFKARFITITATELSGEDGICLEYHWDLEGKLLGFPFLVANKSIDSIYDLCEAVDWIEREIHEGYGINFIGREYDPLLLRQGDDLGVNLRKEAK